jgi:translocation and assembly module TamA
MRQQSGIAKLRRLWQHFGLKLKQGRTLALLSRHGRKSARISLAGCRMMPTVRWGGRWGGRSTRAALGAAVLAIGAILGAPQAARAAEPQPYRIQFVSTGQSSLDSTIKATSQLQTLRTSAPVNPFGLIARARGDVSRLETVLRSFGYYDGSAVITINGLGLDAPGLADSLRALPKGTDAHIRIALTLGPLFRLGRIDVEGKVPAGLERQLDLKSGEPAVASEVLDGGSRLQTALQNHGYAFAKVAPPIAYEVPQQHVLNVTFQVTIGPKVQVGEIQILGLKHVREATVRRRLLLHTGEPYDAARVEKARQDLLALGVFSSVSVELGSAPDSLGRMPITFRVVERPRHTFGINAAYSSDLGGSGGLTWGDRNVFGNAQELDLAATIINLGGTATTGLGYDMSAKYILPDFEERDQTLQFAVSGLKQDLQAYDQTAESAGVSLTRKLSSLWTANAGISAERETDIQEGATFNYTLLSLPLSLLYDSTNLSSPLLDPTHGTRGAVNLTPTLSLGQGRQPNARFNVTQASLSHYFDLSTLVGARPGRTVLAMRAMAGVALGASEFSLPPDQRFYAGGSGTIRGYRYQAVGPQFIDDYNPVGGTTMNAVNLELRQRIGANFGAVLFADGGGVGEGLNPFTITRHCVFTATSPPTAINPTKALPPQTGASCVGIGTGVRYYTPIGPIRLDFAMPTVRRADDDRFEVYIGLGQAF